jgi:hypothetical protein
VHPEIYWVNETKLKQIQAQLYLYFPF